MNPSLPYARPNSVGNQKNISFRAASTPSPATLKNSLSVLLGVLAIVTVSTTAACAQTPANVTPAGPVHRVLVGYFPQWGLYNETPYTVKSLTASGGARMLDQINYAQGFVTGGHCSVADPNADLNFSFTAQNSVDGTADSPAQPLRGNFHQLLELKRLNPHLRITISLEGHGSDFAADAQPAARTAFVTSCVDLFLKGNIAPGVTAAGLFDGIDIDWEYPQGPDGAHYIPLLQEFRRQMDALRPGLLLTVALGPTPRMYGEADLTALGALVDRAGLMTYDFSGPWSQTTGLVAPLSAPVGDSVERSVTSWLRAGIPAEKLLVGLPFYGYGWRDVPDVDHGYRQGGRPIRGDRPYSYIQGLISQDAPVAVMTSVAETAVHRAPPPPPPTPPSAGPETKDAPAPAPPATAAVASTSNAPQPPAPLTAPVIYRDPVSAAPWLFDGGSFWTYDDPTSIRSKASFVAQQQLGGFMVWELSGDTPNATLLNAARSALLNPPPSPETAQSEILQASHLDSLSRQ